MGTTRREEKVVREACFIENSHVRFFGSAWSLGEDRSTLDLTWSTFEFLMKLITSDLCISSRIIDLSWMKKRSSCGILPTFRSEILAKRKFVVVKVIHSNLNRNGKQTSLGRPVVNSCIHFSCVVVVFLFESTSFWSWVALNHFLNLWNPDRKWSFIHFIQHSNKNHARNTVYQIGSITSKTSSLRPILPSPAFSLVMPFPTMLNVAEMFRIKFDKMVDDWSMKRTMNHGGTNTTSREDGRGFPFFRCAWFSDVRISDRLDEIDKWRKTLEYTIQDVDREIQAIQSAKEQCERYLEHMRSPLGNIEGIFFLSFIGWAWI